MDLIDEVNRKLRAKGKETLAKASTAEDVKALAEAGVLPSETGAMAAMLIAQNGSGSQIPEPASLKDASKPVASFHKNTKIDDGRIIVNGPKDMEMQGVQDAFIELAKEKAIEAEKLAKEGITTREQLGSMHEKLSESLILLDSVQTNAGRAGKHSLISDPQKEEIDLALKRLEQAAEALPTEAKSPNGKMARTEMATEVRQAMETMQRVYEWGKTRPQDSAMQLPQAEGMGEVIAELGKQLAADTAQGVAPVIKKAAALSV